MKQSRKLPAPVSTLRRTAILAAVALALPVAELAAEKDICGNETVTYTEDGQSKTYRFIVSGDPRPNGATASPASSQTLVSNDDVALVALFKSVLASVGGALRSIPWTGFAIIFK